VIDILAEGIFIEWTCVQFLRIMKVSMDVTLSVWVALLHGRRAYYEDEPSRDVNPPLDDPLALEELIHNIGSYNSAHGQVLHR